MSESQKKASLSSLATRNHPGIRIGQLGVALLGQYNKEQAGGAMIETCV